MVEDSGYGAPLGLGVEPLGAWEQSSKQPFCLKYQIVQYFEHIHVLSLEMHAYFAFYFIIYEFVST